MKLSNKEIKKQASKNKKKDKNVKKNTAKQKTRQIAENISKQPNNSMQSKQITECLSNMCGYNFDKFIQNNFNENIRYVFSVSPPKNKKKKNAKECVVSANVCLFLPIYIFFCVFHFH